MRHAPTFIALAAIPLLAFGHGSDKPGPHGGSVQMPGAFHVEVVRDSNMLHVYLLGLQITNPTVANSSVVVTVEHSGSATQLPCEADSVQNLFSCGLPGNVDLDSGTLVVDAKRGETSPATARYELPLGES